MKNSKKSLAFCISPHGFGHASQTSSVINYLLTLEPDLNITIKSPLPEAFIRERFHPLVKTYPHLIDFGMVMASSIDILSEESWLRYKDIHDNWESHVGREINDLQQLQPDLVVSNVGYVSLAAAQRLNIPSIAMCSLNWADIFEHYCHSYPGAQNITEQMREAYNSARTFIQFTPCPPMPWINHRSPVSPITQKGKVQRRLINEKLALSSDDNLILIGLGGIEMRLPIESWPQRDNTYWIVPNEWHTQRQDCIPISTIGIPYIDILCSVDALITKPGYGTFSEAVCNQIPFLYVPRGDWPEEPYLEAWVNTYGTAHSISRSQLTTGGFYPTLDTLLQADAKRITPPTANGAQEAAEIILSMLEER